MLSTISRKRWKSEIFRPWWRRRQATRSPPVPKQIVTSKSAPTTGFTEASKPPPIVQAIRFGNMVFVSGQGPLDPETKTVVAGGIEEQTRRTLQNLQSVLDAAG